MKNYLSITTVGVFVAIIFGFIFNLLPITQSRGQSSIVITGPTITPLSTTQTVNTIQNSLLNQSYQKPKSQRRKYKPKEIKIN